MKMGDSIFTVAFGLLAVLLAVGGLAVWRVGQVVSWRALVETALATGSFATCVAYIRFCARRWQ